MRLSKRTKRFQEALRVELWSLYVSAQARNPRFSRRALARRLQVNHTSLGEFLEGKRFLSTAIAEKVSEYVNTQRTVKPEQNPPPETLLH